MKLPRRGSARRRLARTSVKSLAGDLRGLAVKGGRTLMQPLASVIRFDSWEEAVPEEEVTGELYDELLALSPVPNHAELTAGDVLHAFRLLNFRLQQTDSALRAQVIEESKREAQFRVQLARVLDLMDRLVSSVVAGWTVEHEERTLSRDDLRLLYFNVHFTGVTSPPGEKEWADEHLQKLGAVSCGQLKEMMFHLRPRELLRELRERKAYFDTLFVHMDVATESGRSDGSVSLQEFVEGMSIMGFDVEKQPRLLLLVLSFIEAAGLELTRNQFIGLVLLIACRDSNISDDPTAFCVKFRRHMNAVYATAAGEESQLDGGTYVSVLLLLMLWPLVAPFTVYGFVRKRLGSSKLLGMLGTLGVWTLGSFLYLSTMLPTIAFLLPNVSLDTQCTTYFESFYPFLIYTVFAMAAAHSIAYRTLPVRPSSFQLHRLRSTLKREVVEVHVFDEGCMEKRTAYEVLTDGVISERSRRSTGSSLLRRVLEYSYVQVLQQDAQRILLLAIPGFFTFFVFAPCISRLLSLFEHDGGEKLIDYALLDTDHLNGTVNVRIPMHGCDTCLGHSSGDRFVSRSFLLLAFLYSVLMALAHLRLYVQFGTVDSALQRFTAFTTPVEAVKRQKRSLWSAAQMTDRLPFYMKLMTPQNVAAWAKMRQFMLMRFQSEINAVSIFMGYTILFALLLVGLQAGFFLFNKQLAASYTGAGLSVILLTSYSILPLLLITRAAVRINDTISSHRDMLVTQRFEVQDALQRKVVEGKDEEVAVLASTRDLLDNLLPLLELDDSPIRFLGITVSGPFIASTTVALAGPIASVIIRTIYTQTTLAGSS